MSFISYAQNFEDVMLWRALKHVKNGFYIDVGANDPSIDSVTKAFYDRGWSGINIEPLLTHYLDLQHERLRDINLQCAVGAFHGEIEFWDCDVRGWSTADKSVIALHTKNGHEGLFHKVPILLLSEICTTYVKSEIHFLKIDVEGFEKSVIEGMDFSRFRPWILVIEATRPNSTEEVYDEWKGEILSADYVLAYMDGLNCFYVANEHCELLLSLRYPPNVFDRFIRSEQLNFNLRVQQAESKAQQAESIAHQAEAKAQQAESIAHQAEAKAQQSEIALCAINNSTSWRLTAPIRMIGSTAKRVFHLPKTKKLKCKDKCKLLLAHAKLYINRRPKLKRFAFAALTRLPVLEAYIRRITRTGYSKSIYPPVATELTNMTPYARNIYQNLKVALQQKEIR